MGLVSNKEDQERDRRDLQRCGLYSISPVRGSDGFLNNALLDRGPLDGWPNDASPTKKASFQHDKTGNFSNSIPSLACNSRGICYFGAMVLEFRIRKSILSGRDRLLIHVQQIY